MMKLDERTKELIALGASVTANCQPCLEFHASKARAAGCDEEDLAAAVAIAMGVREGAATRMDDFLALFGGSEAPKEPGRGCGCGA